MSDKLPDLLQRMIELWDVTPETDDIPNPLWGAIYAVVRAARRPEDTLEAHYERVKAASVGSKRRVE